MRPDGSIAVFKDTIRCCLQQAHRVVGLLPRTPPSSAACDFRRSPAPAGGRVGHGDAARCGQAGGRAARPCGRGRALRAPRVWAKRGRHPRNSACPRTCSRPGDARAGRGACKAGSQGTRFAFAAEQQDSRPSFPAAADRGAADQPPADCAQPGAPFYP